MTDKKQVLWVSRHEMTPSQRSDLERIMGRAGENGVRLRPRRLAASSPWDTYEAALRRWHSRSP